MDVCAKIIEMISDIVGCEVDSLNKDTHFNEIEDWDSLATISLLASCEKTFNVAISMTQVSKIETIGDLVNAIQK